MGLNDIRPASKPSRRPSLRPPARNIACPPQNGLLYAAPDLSQGRSKSTLTLVESKGKAGQGGLPAHSSSMETPVEQPEAAAEGPKYEGQPDPRKYDTTTRPGVSTSSQLGKLAATSRGHSTNDPSVERVESSLAPHAARGWSASTATLVATASAGPKDKAKQRSPFASASAHNSMATLVGEDSSSAARASGGPKWEGEPDPGKF